VKGPSSGRECEIETVGKQRNGKPRYWCKTHQASATGKYGRRLERCEGAYRAPNEASSLNLNPADYPGGVGLWGSVPAVYDTTRLPSERGVHVHARRDPNGDKEIDGTYPAVALRVARDLIDDARKVLITVETAVASYISHFLDRPILSLFCPYCGEPHLDSEWFAVKMHKRHLCHACGKIFVVGEKCVSNPLERLRHMLGDREKGRCVEPATESLEIRQADFPGGIQIWASNPALVWTAPKAEKEGIHIHCFAPDGETRLIDDTYGTVIIDGVHVHTLHMRYFMAQQALAYLEGKIVSLKCECGAAYFDWGESAFRPHNHRTCASCGDVIQTQGLRKNVVSNPFVDTIAEMKSRAGASS
jgi:transposase-like protein